MGGNDNDYGNAKRNEQFLCSIAVESHENDRSREFRRDFVLGKSNNIPARIYSLKCPIYLDSFRTLSLRSRLARADRILLLVRDALTEETRDAKR